jgi:hypothetical protein
MSFYSVGENLFFHRRVKMFLFNRLGKIALLVFFTVPSFCIAGPNIVEFPGMVDPTTVISGRTSEFSIWIQNLGDTNLHLDFTSHLEFTDANNVSYLAFLRQKGRVITKGAAHCNTSFADLDNDGDLDMVLGAAGGEICYYRNDGSASEPIWRLADSSILGEKPNIEFAPNLVDIDNDGDYDLFLGGQISWTDSAMRFYENTGTVTVPEFSLVSENYLPEISADNRPIPDFVDIDADGDFDLFFGTATPSKLWYYRNDGSPDTPEFVLVTDNFVDVSDYSEPGPALADIDGDGDCDLFIGTANKAIVFFENAGTASDPNFTYVTEHYGADILSTVKNHIAFADLNGDGDYDLYSHSGYLSHFENVGLPNDANWALAAEKVEYDDNVIGTGSGLAWILQFGQAEVLSDMLAGVYDPTLYLTGTDPIGNLFSTVLPTTGNPVTVLSSESPSSGLDEVPSSVSPTTVHQWLKPSFMISVVNIDDEDIRLNADTKLLFGTGTGQEYSANLAEEVLVAAGTTAVLTFERATVCGTLLPDKMYHPKLELVGTYVNNGTLYSQTLYTQRNPVLVTYYQLAWDNATGVSPGTGNKCLVYENGGFLRRSEPHDAEQEKILTFNWSMRQNVPGEIRLQFPDIGQGDPGFDFEMRLDPEYVERDNTSIIDIELAPPYKIWTVFIDNYDKPKYARTQFSVYPREDTLFNHRYEGRIHIAYEYANYDCPYGDGTSVHIGTCASYEIVFDDEVSLDIVSIEDSTETLSYGEVLYVDVAIENKKVYPIWLDLSSGQTRLMFTSEGSDVSSYFEVTKPDSIQIPASTTETITFSVTPAGLAELGTVTIDPTVCYHQYFADGEDTITLSGRKTGSLYSSPITASFDMVSNISGE